jgi:hypothetical protein
MVLLHLEYKSVGNIALTGRVSQISKRSEDILSFHASPAVVGQANARLWSRGSGNVKRRCLFESGSWSWGGRTVDLEQGRGRHLEQGYCASMERGAGILRAGSRNYYQNFINIGILLKIEILMTDFFKNSIFGENYDLLSWIQKSLLLSEIEESTYEREGELKIKLEKERVRGSEREMENF